MYGNMHFAGVKQSLAGIGVRLRTITGGKFQVMREGKSEDTAYETDCLHTAYIRGIKMARA